MYSCMMEEGLLDPLETVSKDPDLIKDAQKDLAKIDVLVCGGCHEVFYFVEEFNKHKAEKQCKEVSSLKCENEEKPQVWAFTLWKAKYLQTLKEKSEVPSSWDIYQKWISLDQLQKDLWIAAGKALQTNYKISSAKVQEIDLKKQMIDKDPLALDDNTTDPLKENKTAVRSSKEAKEEYNVEKILAKRFNPRKRQWEYEIKWENYTEVTWEPMIHLENCKALVQDYEDKIKAAKEKEKPATPRPRGRPRLNSSSPSVTKVIQKKIVAPPIAIISTPGGRPQRTSKQKALNQVKAWCGNISDGDDSGSKRAFEDDNDSDDSFEKKIKLEGESEDTEEDEPKSPPKKIAKIVHTYSNGVGKKLPDNVLIPDAKGVVRISQKQLPSLSSGVYIMSKSSGIIKLDPTASKIATSGGQAIVKVSPKIGQTQIRIIKKDDNPVKKLIQTTKPTGSTSSTATPLKTAKIVQVNTKPQKKEGEKVLKPLVSKPSVTKVLVKEKEEQKFSIKNDEESDDGVEELEFPTDLPLPEPDSPPREFTLDPTTGKVVGREYPCPSPEPVIYEEKKVPPLTSTATETASDTLDNIVKLAAADITEDDLKPDMENIETTQTEPIKVGQATKPGESILNTALSNSNILQKTLMKPKVPKLPPKIINQTVATKVKQPMSPMVRNVITKSNQIRNKPPALPKPKFNIASVNPPVSKPVFSKSPANVARKIGNTTVYKTSVKSSTPPIIKKHLQKEIVHAVEQVKAKAPKPVINMPSLDEEQAVVAPKIAKDSPVKEEQSVAEADLSSFMLAANDKPMYITGDDGTVYEVVGQNEEGQTILLAKDSEGQQQCLLVTNDALQEETPPVENQVLMEVEEPVDTSEEQPLVAQFLRSEPPSPGGTHKVVVMLPGGDVMVTQVTPEEYASLELDK